MLNRTTLRIVSLLSVVSAVTLTTSAASAQTSQYSGQIGSVFLSKAQNYAFRISLNQNGASVLGDCNYGFIYVNADADNYQAYVAELTTLYVRGTPIHASVNHDGNGFCQLIEFGT